MKAFNLKVTEHGIEIYNDDGEFIKESTHLSLGEIITSLREEFPEHHIYVAPDDEEENDTEQEVHSPEVKKSRSIRFVKIKNGKEVFNKVNILPKRLSMKDYKRIQKAYVGTNVVGSAVVGYVYGKTIFSGLALGLCTMLAVDIVTAPVRLKLYDKAVLTEGVK